ncbi:lytA protein [Streptococcus pneumoniae GA43264]|uniref:LytA protein n=1 Tax=Streptococcus pneumoniae TaxID=1313 RepID=Q54890_STREE|nr:ORF [Streptococcus pneumoniae]ACO24114.1 hypothetical protein SPT_1896 [Streptococcus pneumoniae Taiwan19F-14]EDK62715.1 hypothetical protein CGSSp11BS70_11241 [Streptococcus pneumoniae SP11-BS70]EDK65334.1 hypothetical protein CGSSp14BS69_13228 [Streptococcus pneumoniae SP14-BS69]EDK70465.1 hypothetical protein CGSSp19BS75_00891 [Streptococcus pneumoniae SP19-BS75]EDK73364.1 hypothetical protein CGSSp3BS71_11143 [Streptococcus pneumoniae SP3-BS71]EDK75630.1 hypothetical protein CGSSp6BS73
MKRTYRDCKNILLKSFLVWGVIVDRMQTLSVLFTVSK